MAFRSFNTGGSGRKRASKPQPTPEPQRAPVSRQVNRNARPKTPGRSVGAPVPKRSAPARQVNPPVQKGVYGGNGGGGGGGSFAPYSGGGGGGAVAPVQAPEPVKDADWLRANDPEYLAAEAAYKKVYDQLVATISRENTDYDTEFGTAKKNLGWDDSLKGFNWNNVDTAAGRSRRNLVDDFAARGMLQGSGFAEAENSLRNSLLDQYNQLNTSRSQFLSGQEEKKRQGAETRDTNQKLAMAQALSRISAGLQGV